MITGSLAGHSLLIGFAIAALTCLVSSVYLHRMTARPEEPAWRGEPASAERLRRNQRIVVRAAVAAALLLAVLHALSRTSAGEWVLACGDNSSAAYTSFLKRFPESGHAAEATHLLDERSREMAAIGRAAEADFLAHFRQGEAGLGFAIELQTPSSPQWTAIRQGQLQRFSGELERLGFHVVPGGAARTLRITVLESAGPTYTWSGSKRSAASRQLATTLRFCPASAPCVEEQFEVKPSQSPLWSGIVSADEEGATEALWEDVLIQWKANLWSRTFSAPSAGPNQGPERYVCLFLLTALALYGVSRSILNVDDRLALLHNGVSGPAAWLLTGMVAGSLLWMGYLCLVLFGN
jgi:hypothetical protein